MSCGSTQCFSLFWQKFENSRPQKKENFAINSPYIRKTNSPSFIQFFLLGGKFCHILRQLFLGAFGAAFCQFSGGIYNFSVAKSFY